MTRKSLQGAPIAAVERTVVIESCRVVMAVTVLPLSERERMAASIAWFADAALAQPAADAWHVFLDEIIGSHVSFTIDEQRLTDLDANWWSEAIDAAMTAFVQINGLETYLERHVTWGTAVDCRRTLV